MIFKSSDKKTIPLALTKTGSVKRIADVLLIALVMFIRMMRRFAAFAPVNATDIVAVHVSAGHTSEVEARRTVAYSSPKSILKRDHNHAFD